ncbi:YkgJ family cysteine cluster protein [Romboutsia lituseburensis]|uniref:YkgJ family cysteine cluster protein n=1 Tax=Romboutsia lituseburensis TaxID=1537 RepID=UPI00215AD8D6|nr:YkgJ family cysteine cluster protein [Romboutsia lituseburensis]MCR8744295.1 YkgJ family cysteine cluster protein [Romboutsia lituseburensis]
MKKFDCDKCGRCCKSLNLNELYRNLDRGDGICKHLDELDNKCSIYNNRPMICNVNKIYNKYFAEIYTLEEYHIINKRSCKKLRKDI